MIECKNIVKQFDGKTILDNINLTIKKGEFLSILGPSGCGKSTLLQLLAGFDQPTSGHISINGNTDIKPAKDRGFVFQDYALFPWKTVLGNVMSGLDDKKNKKEIAMEYLKKVGLEKHANQYPYTLSGGMKQRVSIARALAYDPEILLMDEPFGALDAQTRKLMQQELLTLLADFNKTIVFVTHSVVEAVYLSNRVVILSSSPAKIVYEKELSFSGKRDFLSDEFLAYRKDILHCLDNFTGLKA